jgi:hypothetical protein
MADRIHAAVQGVQPAALEPVADGAAAEPELDQLAPGNDTVLALGDIGDQLVCL